LISAPGRTKEYALPAQSAEITEEDLREIEKELERKEQS
jgi:hypothetical protein